MTIHIEQWACEVCGRHYDTQAGADQCEALGAWREEDHPPVGCVFGRPQDAATRYAGITFAIAGWNPPGKGESHYRYIAMWAARDNGAGDNYGRETCGMGSTSLRHEGAPDPHHPTFRRLVAWLESQHIPVTVWDGQAPMPLAAYRRWWRASTRPVAGG